MKKKLSLFILLLLPVIVSAYNISEFEKKFIYTYDDYVELTNFTTNSIDFYNYKGYQSIGIKDGKFLTKPSYIDNDEVLLDTYLNNKRIIVSYVEDGYKQLKAYQLDENGKVLNTNSLNIISDSIGKVYIDNNKIYLNSTNDNRYYTVDENANIQPYLLLEDESYFISTGNTLYKIDKNGEIIEDVSSFYLIEFDGNYIYTYTTRYNSSNEFYIELYVYDKNLNEVSHETYVKCTYDLLENINGKVYIVEWYEDGNIYYTIDEEQNIGTDGKTLEELVSEEELTEYQKNNDYMNYIEERDEKIVNVLREKGYDVQYYDIEVVEHNDMYITKVVKKDILSLVGFNKNREIIFETKVSDILSDRYLDWYPLFKVINEGIIVAYLDNNGNNFLESYDFEGKLIKQYEIPEELSNDISPEQLTYYKGRLAVTYIKYEDSSYIVYYETTPSIDFKINGKGKVTLDNEKPSSGDKVSITVIPEVGSVLGNIEIITTDGIKIKVENNTFEMPDSDIIITVTFNPENPLTSDITIISVIAVIALSCFVTIVNKKKLEWLK